VDEHVVPLVTLDEAIPLLVREPLHGALRQRVPPLLQKQATARARAADLIEPGAG
jgi:hypothetical protein